MDNLEFALETYYGDINELAYALEAYTRRSDKKGVVEVLKEKWNSFMKFGREQLSKLANIKIPEIKIHKDIFTGITNVFGSIKDLLFKQKNVINKEDPDESMIDKLKDATDKVKEVLAPLTNLVKNTVGKVVTFPVRYFITVPLDKLRSMATEVLNTAMGQDTSITKFINSYTAMDRYSKEVGVTGIFAHSGKISIVITAIIEAIAAISLVMRIITGGKLINMGINIAANTIKDAIGKESIEVTEENKSNEEITLEEALEVISKTDLTTMEYYVDDNMATEAIKLDRKKFTENVKKAIKSAIEKVNKFLNSLPGYSKFVSKLKGLKVPTPVANALKTMGSTLEKVLKKKDPEDGDVTSLRSAISNYKEKLEKSSYTGSQASIDSTIEFYQKIFNRYASDPMKWRDQIKGLEKNINNLGKGIATEAVTTQTNGGIIKKILLIIGLFTAAIGGVLALKKFKSKGKIDSDDNENDTDDIDDNNEQINDEKTIGNTMHENSKDKDDDDNKTSTSKVNKSTEKEKNDFELRREIADLKLSYMDLEEEIERLTKEINESDAPKGTKTVLMAFSTSRKVLKDQLAKFKDPNSSLTKYLSVLKEYESLCKSQVNELKKMKDNASKEESKKTEQPDFEELHRMAAVEKEANALAKEARAKHKEAMALNKQLKKLCEDKNTSTAKIIWQDCKTLDNDLYNIQTKIYKADSLKNEPKAKELKECKSKLEKVTSQIKENIEKVREEVDAETENNNEELYKLKEKISAMGEEITDLTYDIKDIMDEKGTDSKIEQKLMELRGSRRVVRQEYLKRKNAKEPLEKQIEILKEMQKTYEAQIKSLKSILSSLK